MEHARLAQWFNEHDLFELLPAHGKVVTLDADLPMKHGSKALLTIDVWEHAYYIDFRNARPNYISTFLDSLVNWDFVAQNMAS